MHELVWCSYKKRSIFNIRAVVSCATIEGIWAMKNNKVFRGRREEDPSKVCKRIVHILESRIAYKVVVRYYGSWFLCQLTMDDLIKRLIYIVANPELAKTV